MRYDYLVIGSGSSGGMVAARLSEDPSISILLLEAGGREGHWTIRMPAATRNNFLGGPRNWCFSTEPEPWMDNRRIFQPRGKVIGGSSSLNGMVFVRGHREDFNRWEAAGAEGWSAERFTAKLGTGLAPFGRCIAARPAGCELCAADGGCIARRTA